MSAPFLYCPACGCAMCSHSPEGCRWHPDCFVICPKYVAPRCPNPNCDGTGWVDIEATGTANAYRAPICTVGPHR